MGAGSPENAKGDTVEVDGIVQGHAYLILDVRSPSEFNHAHIPYM